MKQTLRICLDKGLKKALLLFVFAAFMSSSSFAQKTVTGTIIDAETAEPLIGASLLIKGKDKGTVTDIDGKYTIMVEPSDVLILSYTGYTTQEITVGDQSTINISMGQGVTLEELVVTGYSTQSKKNLSGAVSVLEVDEIKAIPVSNIAQAVQGKTTGVTVVNNGSPGGGVAFRIRGFGTVNQNDPLYIIDGIPTGPRAIQDLNPNDIESMQILKDASAASIYGARAANGVVIITTKTGSVDGTSKITFDAYYGVQNPTNLPTLLTPQQLADVTWASTINAGGTPSHPQYGSGSTPTLPTYIIPTGSATADESTYDLASNRITRADQAGTDYFDEIFDSAPIQSYNLSATGGSEKGQYAVSAGYFNQEGVVLGTGYERYSLRANTLFRVQDRIRVGNSLSVAYSESQGGNGASRQNSNNSISMAYRFPSIIPVYDVGGNFAGTGASGFNNPDNPVARLTRAQDNFDKGMRVLASAFLEVDLMEGLTFKTAVNGELRATLDNRSYSIQNIESAEPSANATLNQRVDNNTNWTWYNTLNYAKSFDGKHNINVLVGTEAIEGRYDFFQAGRVKFFSDNLSYRVLNGGEDGISNGGFYVENSIWSVFGKVDYDLAGKYILSATVRRDCSSRFGENNRCGVFPAFSAAWRLSDEDFLKDATWLSDFKVRAGWGQTGNQAIPDFRFLSTYAPNIGESSYAIGGGNNNVTVGFDKNGFGNPDVKWEATTSTNIGFNASLFNNKVDVEFDWFDRTTEDMLLGVAPLSLEGVGNSPFVNIGEINNTGVELGIGYNSSPAKDFTYSVNFNISTYKNTVVALQDSSASYVAGGFREYNAARIEGGQPISAFYGWNIEGIYQNQAEVDAGPEDVNAAPGRFKYVDTNGDGEITADDRDFIGSPHPDFSYGLTAGMGYKNFDLSIFFQGVQGNSVFNGNKLFTDYITYFQGSNKGTALLDSWGYPGADPNSGVPQVNDNQPARELEPSTYYVEDGSYLRLKNISLGYTLPKSTISGIDQLRLYVSGTNVLTFTNYTGIDPEIGVQDYYSQGADNQIGIDRGAYPVVQTWTFGINATF